MTNPTVWVPELNGRGGPRYRAIADALADDIASGRLPAGTQLPTHRDLAFRLGVTVGTVTRAYAEAERRGLAGGEVGRGTFVQRQTDDPGLMRSALSTEPAMAGRAPAGPGAGIIPMTTCAPRQAGAEAALAATMMALGAEGTFEDLLSYPPVAGLATHRAAGARWLARHHRVEVRPESLVMTLGSQNAMAVALATVARPGDVVLTEKLTYTGMKSLAAVLGLHLEGVALDGDGMLPDAFDAACRRLAPKALYIVPTLHNPTAAVMPEARRRDIAAIARAHGVMVIEDDVFGFLVPGTTPICAMAPDITIFVTSLSKSVATGLRVGYAAVPPALLARVEGTVRAFNYSASPLPAEVASRWIVDGTADRLTADQCADAAARQALARSILPSSTVHGHPAGQHMWVSLPEPWRCDDFVAEVQRRGVAITGADTFTVGRTGAPHAVRVSLCMPRTHDDVTRGLTILAEALVNPGMTALSIV
jgi:DNA-binding transcriptional MocR family regulator